MREKLPKLNLQEKKERFRECLFSLDPAFSLDDNFTDTGIKEFQKRYSSKKYYFKYRHDNFREIVGNVNSSGSIVKLTLFTGNLKLEGVWYNKLKDRNIDIIEKYNQFKEISFQKEEEEKEKKKFISEQEEIFLRLKSLVPSNSDILLERCFFTYYSRPFEPFKFNIFIRGLTSEETENMIRKITK